LSRSGSPKQSGAHVDVEMQLSPAVAEELREEVLRRAPAAGGGSEEVSHVLGVPAQASG
jgi:hypothetical protein